MLREQLEHAIRAACDVSGDQEVWVFGSQAILGTYPNAPEALRQSVEVDIAPKNFPDRVLRIEGTLGELSQFFVTHGFYVHGVPIETAILPYEWQTRALKLQNRNTNDFVGWCIECHDLAASKLAAWRDKDRDFVRTLLTERLIRAEKLIERLRQLEIDEELRRVAITWTLATAEDLGD